MSQLPSVFLYSSQAALRTLSLGGPSQESNQQELWNRFQKLVEEWRNQRGLSSSVTQGVLCAAYQSIIGMGESAVPLLLRQLESEGDDPDQWFWALNAITGCQPVQEEDLGNFVKMAHIWLEWWVRNGYVW